MRVLIIGTLDGHVSTAAKIAKNRGATVTLVDSIDTALINLRIGRGADIILIDLKLPVSELIESLEAERFIIPVVSCGIGASPQDAADTIKAGAKEYLPLPPDPELIAAIFEAVAQENHAFIFKDPAMLHWVNLAEKIAPSEANVLITGESGTGKEIMARFIHQKSRRSQKSFISINCAAIPENLLEAELFGYEKGAFTGAVSRRIGKFEEANGGTFLLDEISEMHPRLQAKLLRAIQERVIDRIGSQQPIKINIRIIATSNRNLMEAVKNQDFREDLFFRLNVVHIQLPLLKQRPKDIEALADYFIKKYSELNGLPYRPLSKEALLSLLRHPWIGNVRELENSLHRAVLLAQGDEIQEEDIFSTFAKPTHSEPVQSQPFIGKTVSEVERELILGTLYHCLGNRTQAANILGISIRTLRNKLREYMNASIDVMPPQENIKMSSSR